MIITAALYSRVSTANQEEEATIDSQVAAIENYIQKQQYELPGGFFFLDQGVSGIHLERPALDRLRHLASDGAFSVLVCYSPDRLSRRYAHQWVIIDELQRQGVWVEFVNQPDLGEHPQAQLLLGVQGLFAEYERAMIKERLRLGRLYKMRTGQLMPNATPYGYRYVPRDETGGGSYWLIDEREAEAVRQIFSWYTEENLSIWDISQRLNQSYRHVLRQAQEWQHSVVHRILQRSAYIGRSYLNKERILPESLGTVRTNGRGKRRTMKMEARPQEEWIEVEVPAIVDELLWHRAQERLKLQQKFASRNNKVHFYLLRSLLVCETCGHTLQGRCQNGRVYYFCEYGGKDRYPDVPRHRASIAGNIIEPLVWEAVAEVLKHPEQILAAWEIDAQQVDLKPSEVRRLQARQAKLERQWTRLVDAFQEGLIDKPELTERKLRLDEEREMLGERIAHIQRHQSQKEVKDQVMEEFLTFAGSIQEALEEPAPQVKQDVLRLLVEEIVVGDDMVTIKHIIPVDDFSRLLPRDNMQRTVRRVTQICILS